MTEILVIDEELRLRPYDGHHDFALPWYQDPGTLWGVDHRTEPYDAALLARMYAFLDKKGALYFIELKQSDSYVPVGDVTLCRDDLPIVIAPEYQRRGIGGRVLRGLIAHAGKLGWDHLAVEEIYRDNLGSQRLFLGAGFRKTEDTAQGARYRLEL